MGELRERCCLEMRLRGFSAQTHESYLHALKELCRFYRRPLETLCCDRYTILSGRALGLPEELWRRDRPAEFFFTGQDGHQPLGAGTAQAVYYAALRRSGVRRVGGIHVLRHCFATHLMESGVDIYTIKRGMGHTALVTTGRYMHVTAEHLARVKSPLDTLDSAA